MDRSRLSTLARGLAAAATAGLALLFVGAGASTALAASTPTTPKATTPVSKVPSPVTCGNPGKSGKDKDSDEDDDSDKDDDSDSNDDSDVKDAAVVVCPVPVALPPAPIAAPAPTTSGGVAGVTSSQAPAAAKAVATPKTGAELPLGGALVLVCVGAGALIAGRRLARGARI